MKENKRCYIAGKIGNLPLHEVDEKFNLAKEKVIELGYEPINPRALPHRHGRTWSDYMREDLTAMLTCQYVYAIHDWLDSPGATIEVMLATQLAIPVIHEDEPSDTAKIRKLNT